MKGHAGKVLALSDRWIAGLLSSGACLVPCLPLRKVPNKLDSTDGIPPTLNSFDGAVVSSYEDCWNRWLSAKKLAATIVQGTLGSFWRVRANSLEPLPTSTSLVWIPATVLGHR